MKKTRLGGVAVLGLILGCATASQQQQQQAPAATAEGTQKEQAAAAKKDPDSTLICEEVPVTGSHIPRRICRTQRQAKQEREAAQKALQQPESVNRRMGE